MTAHGTLAGAGGLLTLVLLAGTVGRPAVAAQGGGSLPGKELNLTLAAPTRTWDERPAKGIRRKDFNYATMVRLVAEGKNRELNAIFDRPTATHTPPKSPPGGWRSPWTPRSASRASS